MIIKLIGKKREIFNCPFDIGNIVELTNFGRIYFREWVDRHPHLKEKCQNQCYNTNGIYPKEWKIIDVVVNGYRGQENIDLSVLLRARTKEELLIQVIIYGSRGGHYFCEEKRTVPFKIIDTHRKAKKYLETNINFY